jgi:starch synthase
VVATRAGGLEHVVQHDHTGLLVEVDDGAGFVRAIESLLDDPAAARRLGKAARRRARERFDWPRHVLAYDDLYRRLAA